MSTSNEPPLSEQLTSIVLDLMGRIPTPGYCERTARNPAAVLQEVAALQEARQHSLAEAVRQPKQTKSAARNKAKRRQTKSDVDKLAKLLGQLSDEQVEALMAAQQPDN